MKYEDFKSVFMKALRASGLPIIGAAGKETLDLHTTDRTFTIYVEPAKPRRGSPFHVSGTVSWLWDALQEARTATTEEDMLTELLGRERAGSVETERPWLRVDLKIRAGLLPETSMPMPKAATWAKWSLDVAERVHGASPLVTNAVTRETGGKHFVLSWQGKPEVTLKMNPVGKLLLDSMSLSAFQGIDLPRHWDDPDHEGDEEPDVQLKAMFDRVKRNLAAWGECLEHFE